MANDNLNTAIASLTLGGGGVYNLMNYVGAFHLGGGLKRYTLGKGYFLSNIMNNFSGGKRGRYGYGDAGADAETVKKEIINGTDGVVYDSSAQDHLTTARRSGDMIGDYYTTKVVPGTSEKEFMDVRTFSKLGEEIRNKQKKRDFEKYIKEHKYNVDGSDAFGEENNVRNETGIKNTHSFGEVTSVEDSNLSDEFKDVLIRDYDRIVVALNKNENTPQKPYKNSVEKLEVGIQIENNDFWGLSGSAKTPYGFEKYHDSFPKKFSLENIGEKIRDIYKANIFYGVSKEDNKKDNKNEVNSFIFADTKKVNIGTIKDDIDKVTTINNEINSKLKSLGPVPFRIKYHGLYDFYNGTDDETKEIRKNFTPDSKEGKIKNAVELRRENRSRNQAARLYYNAYYGNYDVLKTEPEATNYVVPDAYKYNTNKAEEGKFNTKDFKESLISAGSNSKPETLQYSYYEENDNGKTHVFGLSSVYNGVPIVVKPVEEDTKERLNEKAHTLINKVNRKFQEGKIKSLINRFHTEAVGGDDLTTAVSSYGLSRGRNLLRKDAEDGKNSNKSAAGFDNPYCRVWTAHHQYSKVKDLIRPMGDDATTIVQLQQKLYKGDDERSLMRPKPELFTNSVLQDSGFVRITPQHDDKGNFEGKENLKPYMFSIENLAWKGFAKSPWLSKEQIGPNGGRIMWFPPYNLKFTENVNTSWKDNDFIGRGEKIYTYVNTERSGTLNFTLLIDHPSFLNKIDSSGKKEDIEKDILRYFAGCDDDLPFKKNAPETKHVIKRYTEEKEDKTTEERYDPQGTQVRNYVIFFPNYYSGMDEESDIEKFKEMLDQYEMVADGSSTDVADSKYDDKNAVFKTNLNLYALNTKSGLTANIDKVVDLIGEIDAESEKNTIYSYEDLKKIEDEMKAGGNFFDLEPDLYEIEGIYFGGHASSHGSQDDNEGLCKRRARVMKALLKYIYGEIDTGLFSDETNESIINVSSELDAIAKEKNTNRLNNLDAKIARCATVKVVLQLKKKIKIDHVNRELIPVTEEYDIENGEIKNRVTYTGTSQFNRDVEASSELGESRVEDEWRGTREYVVYNKSGEYTYQNEYLYFETIKKENNIVYKNIVDKIKYFDPAFHSLTPEGFNARLNFLHQSTRQGPTLGSHAGGGAVTEDSNGNKIFNAAGNMAFGMAPYCVLRIGDFFNSKICITSLSIDYDNGGGVQWDLNPEGAGVQPMMANISINFNFVGGQDITGPIAELQNALSFRYYANTSLYEDKARVAAKKIIGYNTNDNNRPIYGE